MKLLLSVLAAAATSVSMALAASSSATATSSAAAATHTVQVALDGFTYSPDNITAAVGDTILFRFYPTGHSVVRAAFGHPCIPYEYVETDQQGFFSGFEDVTDPTNPATWSLRINDTQPVFFYCSAPNACNVDHRIGVINPNATFTLEAQLNILLTMNATQLSPGQAFPTEGGAGSTATPGPTSTSTSPAAGATSSTGSDSGSSSSSPSLSGGAIAGIAIGGAAVLLLGAALVWFCGRKGGIEKGYRRSTARHAPHTPPMVEANYPGEPDLKDAQYPQQPHQDGPSELHSPFGPPGSDTYRSGNTSPGLVSQDTGSHMSGQYPAQPSPGFTYVDPGHESYYNQNQPKPDMQEPVELPTSRDPGNSPLPGYQDPQRYSWSAGAETGYRPSEKGRLDPRH